MRQPDHMLLLALGAALALAGCSNGEGRERWPTLAPRPGEISPLVPRTPLGACAGCGQDVFNAPAEPAPPALAPAPADAAARLDAIDAAISAVEASLPAQRGAVAAAVAAAAANPGDDDLAGTAEVERSRLELLYVPLLEHSHALDMVSDALVGKADADALRMRVASLRERLARLEADQLAGGGARLQP